MITLPPLLMPEPANCSKSPFTLSSDPDEPVTAPALSKDREFKVALPDRTSVAVPSPSN